MKLKELPKAPIQIQRDNLLAEVEQLKTALLQKDNIIATKSNTITELHNKLSVQTNLVTTISTELTHLKNALTNKISEADILATRVTDKHFLLTKTKEELYTLTTQTSLEFEHKEQLLIQKEMELKTLQVTLNEEKEKLIIIQQQLTLKNSQLQELNQTFITRTEELENKSEALEALKQQLEQQKILEQQKNIKINELENLNRQQGESISKLNEKADTLNSLLEESKNQFSKQTNIVKDLQEVHYKTELTIKEMEKSLLKKDLIVQELENKVVISEIKTAPAINSELVLLKEQLADKNLIIELLKSQKAPVFEISDSKILESLDLDNISQQPIITANIQTNPLLQFENMHITTSVLLSGDVSLIEEEEEELI
jgi:hypothetical protein